MAFEDELTKKQKMKIKLGKAGRKAKNRASVIGGRAKEQIKQQQAKVKQKRAEAAVIKKEIQDAADKVYKEERKKVLTERAISKAKKRASTPPISEQIGKAVGGIQKMQKTMSKGKGGTKPISILGGGGLDFDLGVGSGKKGKRQKKIKLI